MLPAPSLLVVILVRTCDSLFEITKHLSVAGKPPQIVGFPPIKLPVAPYTFDGKLGQSRHCLLPDWPKSITSDLTPLLVGFPLVIRNFVTVRDHDVRLKM